MTTPVPRLLALAAFALLLSSPAPLAGASGSDRGEPSPTGGAHRSASFDPGRALLHFEENRGQTDARVEFLARGRGYRAYFTGEEAVFVLDRGAGTPPAPFPTAAPPKAGTDVLRMRFAGARSAPGVVATDPLPGRSHYLIGALPEEWVTGVPHSRGILYRNLWPGVDLRWRGGPGRTLEYEFLVAPGGDPGAIGLDFAGAKGVRIDDHGFLVLDTGSGVLRHSPPRLWQESGGRRTEVAGSFVLGSGSRVGFAVGPYDAALPLLIDPEVVYSTYIGGPSNEEIRAIVTDSAGRAYLAGSTGSSTFPSVNAFQPARAHNTDAFVTVFSADGQSIVYSTFLGSGNDDHAFDLAVDGDGQIVVVGSAESSNFPKKNAIQGFVAGNKDAFITKLNASGSALVFSTLLGGSNSDQAHCVCLDADGSVFVAGEAFSTNFPTTAGAFQEDYGGLNQDGWVARLPADGTVLTWCTYLGGASDEEPRDIVLGSGGGPVVTGLTFSADFPTETPFQAERGGAMDAFVTCMDPDGQGLAWSSFLGGSANDHATGVAATSDGTLWVCGGTLSTDFPVIGGFQETNAGQSDAFVTRISSTGSQVQMATYLGGSSFDQAGGIAVDKGGAAFTVGITNSTNFPLQLPLQDTFRGNYDVFVTMFGKVAASPPFSTYFGGGGDDRGSAIATAPGGRILIGGFSYAGTDYPLQAPYQAAANDGWDAILTSILHVPDPPENLDARLIGLTDVEVTWTDPNSPGRVTGHELERKVDDGPFELLAVLDPETLSYEDHGLSPSTDYTYRVRGDSDGGTTEYSNEDLIRTPPPPTSAPAAPSALVATVASPRMVDLSWTDNSDNEGYFVLARGTNGVFFDTLSTPYLDATSASDTSALPGRTYWYFLRAVNPIGSSQGVVSNSVTMPSTLTFALTKGKVKDKAKSRGDMVQFTGIVAPGPGAAIEVVNPVAAGMELHRGGFTDQRVLRILPVDGTWRTKGAKSTWKSLKTDPSKAKVVYDSSTGTLTVKVSKLDLATAAGTPFILTLGVGDEAVVSEETWTEVKPGLLTFP